MVQQIIVYIIIAMALLAMGRRFWKRKNRKKSQDNPACSSCPLKGNCGKLAGGKEKCPET